MHPASAAAVDNKSCTIKGVASLGSRCCETPEGIVVMGDVSNEVKEMMAPFHPIFLGSSLGFSRSGGRKVVEAAS